MSDDSHFTLWEISIDPPAFPLAGKWLVTQLPSNNFPSNGWWFVFPSLGSPNDSRFTTTIGDKTYTFNVEHRDNDKASGTVTTPESDDGTWSAQGQSGTGGPGL